MDIEKLIAGLSKEAYGSDVEELLLEAATALSTLQGENKQLRGELEYEQEHANAYHEECGQWEAENEKLRAELYSLRPGFQNQKALIKQLRTELEQKEKYYEQMVDALAATESTELEQVKRERDAAVNCIKGIEDALNFQRISAISLRISEWHGKKED